MSVYEAALLRELALGAVVLAIGFVAPLIYVLCKKPKKG